MMKEKRPFSVGIEWVFYLSCILSWSVDAALPLSNGPLFLGGSITPNVVFTLDDSGSMQQEIMPEGLAPNGVRFVFPRAESVYNNSSDFDNKVVAFMVNDPGSGYAASLRSSQVNKVYYNPTVRYQPWSNADGSLMPAVNPTCAPHNPMNTGAGCRNLIVENKQAAEWLKSNGSLSSSESKTFYPAVYFKYKDNGGNVYAAANYTQVEIRLPKLFYTGGPGRTDCIAAPTCTYIEEIQNFANWYTYYRSRVLLSRAGIGRAFATQGNTMRVGFAAINQGNSIVDGVRTKTLISGVRPFIGAGRTEFFTNLYSHPIPKANTPLRAAMDDVGQYFQRTDDKGPWSDTPGDKGGEQHECRQNYHILMTDGYWTGGVGGRIGGGAENADNEDSEVGMTITNHASPAIPPNYTYTPVLPYSDPNPGTLADVAMLYWKNDLRPDLLNKVPTSSGNPAFWQHMVNFTVGLGVQGTLVTPPSGTETWPDTMSSEAAKIDDLWHAAINSRGKFFSAADPVTFADALSNSLSTIVARTGSAAAVAVNAGSLMAHSRIYQTKFNSGDWSGQLLSIPINTAGVSGTAEWNAGTVSLAPTTVSPDSRVIITKGNSDGVPFQYLKLSATQKASLDKNNAGLLDTCGLERVAYLRGSASGEGGTGTLLCVSTTIINKFRKRTTSLLGDIVNGAPFYVDKPGAGYSDVDHAGYAAFVNNYKNRTPVVYVGANDGMLHGFNACIVGVTPGCIAADAGKELIAYVPGGVYANLNRLSNQDYHDNHRYFVDGSLMVADAHIGTTPSWKTVLVGGLNGGGQGYYALDVTNPANFTNANAASIVLWEFTDADDGDMGYSHNLPTIALNGQAQQIVRMENGQWAVIVGNGYNSVAGKAVLYILFISGGEDGTWTVGTDYIRLVADTGTGNGLSTPTPFDSNANGLVDVIYAGDIRGNLWKFDVSSTTPASWNVAVAGAPLFVSGSQKPIISPPVVSLHPKGGQLILFGTGKYLETADTTNKDGQSVYGIWDNNTTATIATGALVQQVMTDASIRTATQNSVAYSATIKGWYLDLPISGERLTGVPAIENNLYTFTTIIPSISPCDFGGRGFVNTVDFLTGSMLSIPAFDTNGNRIIAFDDALSAGVEIGFSVGGVTRVRGQTQDWLLSSRADGELVKTPATKGPAEPQSRIVWQELIQ
ncbi:type IV pilus assembly protein PilY1 [Nitrosomonas cryotolerans]|nr:PilC/PilY family type IV pilus protein [Nitrosomonas cryotolerans]SFP82100.1 type IV pilus assembly protein PilY1 [Nitrosomonas cryotolerans]